MNPPQFEAFKRETKEADERVDSLDEDIDAETKEKNRLQAEKNKGRCRYDVHTSFRLYAPIRMVLQLLLMRLSYRVTQMVLDLGWVEIGIRCSVILLGQ